MDYNDELSLSLHQILVDSDQIDGAQSIDEVFNLRMSELAFFNSDASYDIQFQTAHSFASEIDCSS